MPFLQDFPPRQAGATAAGEEWVGEEVRYLCGQGSLSQTRSLAASCKRPSYVCFHIYSFCGVFPGLGWLQRSQLPCSQPTGFFPTTTTFPTQSLSNLRFSADRRSLRSLTLVRNLSSLHGLGYDFFTFPKPSLMYFTLDIAVYIIYFPGSIPKHLQSQPMAPDPLPCAMYSHRIFLQQLIHDAVSSRSREEIGLCQIDLGIFLPSHWLTEFLRHGWRKPADHVRTDSLTGLRLC